MIMHVTHHVLALVAVPLMMAYVTRYIFGTDKLRPNAFEVRGLNGASTGIIHCDDAAILSQWLKYITDNIVGLTNLQVAMLYTYRRLAKMWIDIDSALQLSSVVAGVKRQT
jgi:hypothetical protein